MAPRSAELDQLAAHNRAELGKLAPAAASQVQCLLGELERDTRPTHLRLYGAVPGGHRVRFAFVRGRADLVGRLGRALRFARVTENELEAAAG